VQSSEIRTRFLRFFEERGHRIVPSSPLIPHNDPTLFFVNAGMVPFKDVFTGAEVRDYTRATSSQRCLRVSGKHNDLDNVGRTARHHTLFEMLGSFSFGDYFKDQAIPMAWELLTEEFKVDGDRLWVTVLDEDEEAYAIWRDKVGFPEARLQRLGAKDNFWSMGETGPCGPCSEIHYDHGPSISDDIRGPAGEDDRYVEIWNNVFMQYEQTASGERLDLPNPSIDTGMGFERIAAVLQGVYWNYDTDIFQPIIRRGAELTGVRYGESQEADTALRVMADHARAGAFLVGDGVMPARDGRGYVLRRVLRRAIRFGVKLGVDTPFMHDLAGVVIEGMSDAYPDLGRREGFIREVVLREEESFRRTIHKGMNLLSGELESAEEVLDGKVAFTLYDTHGFPVDLTQQIAAEQGMSVDLSGYQAAMEEQRARGRAGWKGSGEQAVEGLWKALASELGPTRFTGYDRTEDVGTVLAIVRSTDAGHERVESLTEGDEGVVLLDATPFYAESGGQVGDSGHTGAFTVTDTTGAAGLTLHRGIATGAVAVGDLIPVVVDAAQRDATRRNHTGTHLLHTALQSVLGSHVTQKGSLVGPRRLRFDFSHFQAMTGEELAAVEDRVNAEILKNTEVTTTLESLEEAKSRGAMALFGEKYDADVRVVEVGGYSVELCGGTHCIRTGDIGLFRITQETGIAEGVRRIEAQTGLWALQVVRHRDGLLSAAARQLKTNAEQLLVGITKLQEDRKHLERQLKEIHKEAARAAAGDLAGQAKDIGGVKVLAAEVEGDLKDQADRLRDQLGSAFIVLAGRKGPKVLLVVAATKDLAGRVHAGNLVREIAPMVGGGGGGRPDMAQAGGKNPDGIPAALQRAWDYAAEQLSQ